MIRFLVRDIVGTEHTDILDELSSQQRLLAELRLSEADVAGALCCSLKLAPLRLRVVARARSGCAALEFTRVRLFDTVCMQLKEGLSEYLTQRKRLCDGRTEPLVCTAFVLL